MIAEIDLYGVFISNLLPCVLLAMLLTALLRRLLLLAGAYRFVWHRPLFDLALFVLLLGGIVALASRWSS